MTTSDRILHHAETLIEELQNDREVSWWHLSIAELLSILRLELYIQMLLLASTMDLELPFQKP